METRSKRRKTEPVADKIRRGEISVVVAIAEELPDVFTGEILPKLDGRATLNLAQVSKWYNDAVWSVDGVRSMKEKIEAEIKAASTGYSSEPLYWAATYGNLPAVRAILKFGVDVNVNFNRYYKGGKYVDDAALWTPLHCAAEEGHTPVVKVLIEAGADVNKKTYCAQTSLHRAACKGHVSVITELIKAGADVNATNEHDISHRILPWSTSLHYAVRFEHEDCVAVLLAHGADVHYADDGWINADVRYPHNPMRQAVLSKNKKIIEMLKQAGG